MKRFIKSLIVVMMVFPFLQQMAEKERGFPALGGEWFLLILGPVIFSVLSTTLKEMKE